MQLKPIIALALSSTVSLYSTAANSENLPIRMSGFLTTGVSISDNEIPYLSNREITDEFNFDADTVLGIQLDSTLDDKTRVSAQLIANLTSDNYDTNAEWLFVERNISNNLSARAGRLRLPLFAASRYIYVGAAYPWVRPPEEVYSQLAGINRFTGLDVIWQDSFGNSNITLQPFVGSMNEDVEISGNSTNISTDSLFGLTAKLTWEAFNLQAMYVRMDSTLSYGNGTEFDSDVNISTVALQYQPGNLDLRTEWSQRDANVTGKGVGWYGTIAYNYNEFTPYLTLGIRDTRDVDPDSPMVAGSSKSKMISTEQAVREFTRDSETVAVGLRWDLSPQLSLKGELHHGKAKSGSKGLFDDYVADEENPEQLADEDVLLASFTVNVLF